MLPSVCTGGLAEGSQVDLGLPCTSVLSPVLVFLSTRLGWPAQGGMRDRSAQRTQHWLLGRRCQQATPLGSKDT